MPCIGLAIFITVSKSVISNDASHKQKHVIDHLATPKGFTCKDYIRSATRTGALT